METNRQNRRQQLHHNQPALGDRRVSDVDGVINDFVQQLTDELVLILTPTIENSYGNPRRRSSNNNNNNNSENQPPNTRTGIDNEYDSVIYTIRNVMNAYNENYRFFLELMNNIQHNIAEQLRNNSSANQNQRRQQRRPFRTETTNTNTPNTAHPSMFFERHPNRDIYTRQHYPSNEPRFHVAPQEQRVNRTNPLIHILQNVFETTENNMQNVVVRPSAQQIEHATRRIVYSADTPNIYPNCPITLENFENGQFIRQIIHCGHCFSEDSMESWFRVNVRCPVCRYDIRDSSSSERDVSENDTRTFENEEQPPISNMRDLINSFGASFTNIIQTANNSDMSGNRIYTYEMPIIYYRDLSYNFDYQDDDTLEMVD